MLCNSKGVAFYVLIFLLNFVLQHKVGKLEEILISASQILLVDLFYEKKFIGNRYTDCFPALFIKLLHYSLLLLHCFSPENFYTGKIHGQLL